MDPQPGQFYRMKSFATLWQIRAMDVDKDFIRLRAGSAVFECSFKYFSEIFEENLAE
jgi:hypothetical protein